MPDLTQKNIPRPNMTTGIKKAITAEPLLAETTYTITIKAGKVKTTSSVPAQLFPLALGVLLLVL